VAQFLTAWTFVVDPLQDSKHFLIPVIAGAHRDFESVARLPNCLSIDENQPMKFRLLRLGRMVDSTPKTAVDDEAALAVRVYATPSSCAGTVASPALRFSTAKDTSWIAYRSPDAIPREDQVEQRVQQMLLTLLRIARPDDQRTFGVRGRYQKFARAVVSPVKAMDERSWHLRIEF
jgi:hypothetical protein